ncbi:unnamed protein product [Closterium sp. NIES-65]|nr:unnamed protein product [Closterium sp. NIES-65]
MAGVAPPAGSSAIPDLNEPFMEEDVDAARANIPADMVVGVDAARAKIPVDPTIPLPPGTKGAPEPEPDRYSPRSDTEQPPPIGPFPENDYMYLTVEDLLAADEKDDAFLQNIPRDDFAEAAFDINKELAKKNRLLRMMWGFRHLDTLEARTTRVQYLRALLDFRRWCCANLPRQQTARVKGDGVLEHEDEIGRYIDEDMALQTACKVEGTLFGVKELHIMYDISEFRSEVRAMVREKWHRDDRDCVDRHRGMLGDTYTTDQIRHLMFKVLPTWAARAYEPKAATPSQTLWKFLLMKTMTLLGHHTLLRGASLRAIELPDLFLYKMGSASPEHSTRRPVVMVVASRNSKTNKDARLHHSYAARHLEQEICAVGHTLLWLHFVYDQLSRSPTSRCVPPLDFTTPYSWYHKHLFHARNDKAQKELPASSHSRIMKEMWRTNKIFITRNTHAARAGGAQELADDGVPRFEIADLGHWALDKLAKSYITTIPKAAVLRKAGYTGKRGDYHLGRSMVKPDDKVVALIAQHIFPWAEAELAKVSISDGKNADNPPTISTTTLYRRLIVFVFVFDSQAVRCASAREPNTAGVHFLQSLIEFGRRIVAEDLVCMLMREPWHPYIQSSKLCRDPDFQKWAKDVNKVDVETIATRSTPSENPQEVEKGDKPAASAKSAKSSRPTTEVGETGKNDALQQCTRRMRRIMEAVHDLRRSDDAADTAAVIKLLDHLGRAGLSTFSDALLVLRATPPIKVPTTADGKSVGIKGLDKPLARKLAAAWGMVTAGYMDADWGKRLFGDLWDEQANKAGLEAEATAKAIGVGKRKRAG